MLTEPPHTNGKVVDGVYNQKAIEADLQFLERDGAMNFYTAYRIHNYHFAIDGAMFLGQYEPALAAAEELVETVIDTIRQTALTGSEGQIGDGKIFLLPIADIIDSTDGRRDTAVL